MTFKKKHTNPKTLLLLFTWLFFIGIFFWLLSDPVHAAQFGLSDTAKEAGLTSGGAPSSVPEVIARIISAALGLVGAIFFMLMVYAGFLWMMARGNEEQVKKAKGMIGSAIMGIIVVAAAYGITNLVISSTLGRSGGNGESGEEDLDMTVPLVPCETHAECSGLGYGYTGSCDYDPEIGLGGECTLGNVRASALKAQAQL